MLLITIIVVFLKSFKFEWSITTSDIFEYIVGCIGQCQFPIYHLTIFLIIWDGFDSDAQNQ